MAEKAPPTYEELAALRAKEWQIAQTQAAAMLADDQAKFLAMPDVRAAPRPTEPWSHPAIACACGSGTFRCSRWVTVNGVRHRTELHCVACHRIETWDWALMAWCP